MQVLTTDSPTTRTDWRDAYLELRQTVRAAGLLERAYGYYAALGAASLSLLAAALVVSFARASPTGWNLLAILLLGVAIVQCCLFGHDAGHVAIFRRPRANWLIGQLGWSLIGGVGFWYWNDRHNRHHGRTNDVTTDPDLRPSLLDAFLGRFGAVVTVLSIFLSALTFRAEGWRYTLGTLRGRQRVVETILLSLNVVLWGGFFALLGWRGVGLFVGSQVVSSIYLTAIIAPNHRGMPMWTEGVDLSYLERQVLSSRNLTTNPVYDLFYGGLNSQIEHHLFPTMPRPHLRRARAIIKPFCTARDLSYEDVTPLTAYGRVVAALREGESLASMLD